MFSTIILSMALAFVAVAQTLSRVRCRSLECIRTVDEPPKGGAPRRVEQTTPKRPTLNAPNCAPFVRRTDGLEMMNVSPSYSSM
jgi:hypothetical protein